MPGFCGINLCNILEIQGLYCLFIRVGMEVLYA